MSTFCNGIVLKFGDLVPENLPNFAFDANKFVYHGFRIGHQVELFLKAENGKWTEDNIKQLREKYIKMRADLHYPPSCEFSRPMIDDRVMERKDLFPLPSDIQCIIFGYVLTDSAQEAFPKTIAEESLRIHFKGFYIANHGWTMTVQNNEWQLNLREDFISIKVGDCCYYYDDNLSILIPNCPHHVVYNNGFMIKRSTLSVHEKYIPKLCIKVIEHFDPKNEFGLLRLFGPVIDTTKF